MITDTYFRNAKVFQSQLGFVVLLCDEHADANIVHYGYSRCKRVTRSLMAAVLHALVTGFDYAFVISNMVVHMLGKRVPLESYVDSNTVLT